MTVKNPRISSRALLTPPSPIRKLSAIANRAKAAGKHVYHLNIGQPDLESPQEFYAGVKSFAETTLAYEDSKGFYPLRQALSNFFNKFSKQKTDPDQFLVTTGASEALIFAFNVCCDADDEIVVFDPSYANYMSFAATAGITLVPVRTEIGNHFCLPDNQEINSKISHRTRAILLCNPNNPTGTCYPEKDLLRLIGIAKERGLFLIVDETYREFVFDNIKPVSVLELSDDQNLIVIDSLSKRYSLCGARIGCLYSANSGVMQSALSLAQARLSVSTIEQHAAAHMLNTVTDKYVEKFRQIYQGRRNCLLDSLKKIDGVKIANPEGAFYAIAELPVENAEDFAIFMLEKFSLNNSTTFLAPAEGFYLESGRGVSEVRLAYVLSEQDLVKAVENINHALLQYKAN